MKAEFPGRDSKVFDAVSTVRSRYNNGVLAPLKGVAPKVKSVVYDDDGLAKAARGSGKKIKTKKKVKGKKVKTKKKSKSK